MTPQELRVRIKTFAHRCVHVCEALPLSRLSAAVIAKQLIRSSLSASTNYRSATRAQSKAQFLAKLNIALEEIDESVEWLENIVDLEIIPIDKLEHLLDEGNQLVKILGAAKNTLQIKLGKKPEKVFQQIPDIQS